MSRHPLRGIERRRLVATMEKWDMLRKHVEIRLLT